MSVEFMQRMVSSYNGVHNRVYWKEITPVLEQLENTKPVIMDLGCGPGLLLKDLASKLTPSKIIGVDLSEIMLDRAKEELDEFISNHSETKLELIAQHLQDNPHLPSGIDLIVSSRVIRSFEDQEQTMLSIYHSLNPGGYFILLDWTKTSIKEYEQWFSKGEHFNNLTNWDIIKYHRNFSRYDLDDWKYILESANFKIIKQFQINPVHSCTIVRKPKL